MLLIIGGAFLAGYKMGQNQQQIKYITKEVEVVKEISQKKAIIHARPNITRDNALKLMRANKL